MPLGGRFEQVGAIDHARLAPELPGGNFFGEHPAVGAGVGELGIGVGNGMRRYVELRAGVAVGGQDLAVVGAQRSDLQVFVHVKRRKPGGRPRRGVSRRDQQREVDDPGLLIGSFGRNRTDAGDRQCGGQQCEETQINPNLRMRGVVRGMSQGGCSWKGGVRLRSIVTAPLRIATIYRAQTFGCERRLETPDAYSASAEFRCGLLIDRPQRCGSAGDVSTFPPNWWKK